MIILISKEKGSHYERRLVELLWRRGFACVRGGSSGGGCRRRFVPDVIAMRNGVILVFEVKIRSKEDVVYIEATKVSKLLDFAKRAGGRAFIAIKYGRSEWKFIPVDKLSPSLTGASYRIDPDMVKRDGLTLRDLEVMCSLGKVSNLGKWLNGDSHE